MTSRQDELAAWLGGSRLEEQVAKGNGSITSTIYGTATGDSTNGSVEVIFTDDVVNYEDEDGEVQGTNAVELPTEIDVREGDEVRIAAVGPDGFKTLTVVGVVAGGDRTKEAVDEAQAAIEATNQLVWKDDNGVHVAEDQEQTGANLLANSLGVILRLGQNILAAMTQSAFTIYDGLGNAASNVLASFGTTTTIGSADGAHSRMVLDSTSLRLTEPTSSQDTAVRIGYGEFFDSSFQPVNGGYIEAGTSNVAEAPNSIAVGERNIYSNVNDVAAIGRGNTIGSDNSLAFGTNNSIDEYLAPGSLTPSGWKNYIIGDDNECDGAGGMAFGRGLVTEGKQVALGNYNDNTVAHPFVVGDGADDNNRHNAFYIDSNGDAYANGGKLATAGTTLWSSSTGSDLSTAVNLSESVENYKFIEVVYFISGSNVRYTARAGVYHSNTTHRAWIRLLNTSSLASNQIVLFAGTIDANGSSASATGVNTITIKTTPSVAIASSSNLRVVEIIGYK